MRPIAKAWTERVEWIANYLPLLAAVLLWAVTFTNTDPGQMNDLGLVSVLPIWYYAALVMLSVSFTYQLFKGKNQTSLLLHSVLLVLILYGTPQFLYGTLRYSWTWKHIGVIDYIQRHGNINLSLQLLGGYQNWPGFFIFGTLLNEAAGLSSALAYAGWGPVFFDLIDACALVFLFRSLTKDERLIWLGVWFFLLGNWIGQDYFSPQAMSYFFYLVILAIIIRWFRVSSPPARQTIKKWVRMDWISGKVQQIFANSISIGNSENVSNRLIQAGLITLIIMFSLVIISSHQLTPFMLVSAVTFLVIFQVFRIIRFPLALIALTGGWLIFMAASFLQSNTYWIVKTIGLLIFNSRYIVVNANQLSSNQALVANITRIYSALVVGFALLGLMRRIVNKHWDLPAVLLLISPIPLLAANNYGGEMRLRVYYFVLPFLAFLGAGLFFPTIKAARSYLARVATTGAIFLLIGGFLFAAYGREELNYFTPNEVQASEYLMQVAPSGSTIIDGTWNWPKYFINYENYQYVTVSEYFSKSQNRLLSDPVTAIAGLMNHYQSPYLIITRSQIDQVDMLHYLPPGSLQQIEADLLKSPEFHVVYQNPDAVIFTLTASMTSPVASNNSIP